MMKAYLRTDAGSIRVELRDMPVPEIGADEVLVEIEAFGVGIHDRYFIPRNARFAYVIGTEAVGRIVRLGAEVSGHAVGDRVAFTSALQLKDGTWAKFAAVSASALIPVPEDLPTPEAATVPIAGRTALNCLADLDPAPGSTLFIAGASGAIGTFAIQLAVKRGVRVAGSASPRNHDHMKSLGADLCVDYAAPGWQRAVHGWAGGGVDAALAIQPGTGAGAIKAVRDGGSVLTVSGDNDEVPPERASASLR